MKAAAASTFTMFLTSLSIPPVLASTTELSSGVTVRIKISELDEVWQVGTVDFTDEGCAVVWIPDAKASGSRCGYGLLFLDKLERQEGEVWIDIPLEPLIATEPKPCQEGAD
ncbi:MAG: hypothetical protein ABL970_14575 [Nitrospira sp.]